MPGAVELVIVGASDQARVVLWIAERIYGAISLRAVLDASPEGALVGTRACGVTVRGTVEDLSPDDRTALVVPAVGHAALRSRTVQVAAEHGLELTTLVDPSAIVSSTATVGHGTVVSPFAVVGPNARVGAAVIVNTGAIIEHDVVLGDCVHVGPGAVVAGRTRVGANAWIGAGAVIRDDITVGEAAVVGAGAAVVGDVTVGTTVVGVPAKSQRI